MTGSSLFLEINLTEANLSGRGNKVEKFSAPLGLASNNMMLSFSMNINGHRKLFKGAVQYLR